jgi:hypothetical protein
VGAIKRRMQIRSNVGTVLRAVGRVAPATTGAVIHADSAVAGDDRRNPTEVRGGRPETWFQDDRGAARSGAVQVQPVPTHVNQLAGHGIGPGVERLAYGLITAAYRGNPQRGQYQVDQPPCASGAQLPPGPQKHPDDEPKQCWRPHPAKQIVYGGGPAE